MSQHFIFTKPMFTARTVAKVIGQKLGRKLSYQEADDDHEVDGNVDVTSRVSVQVGADYLAVSAQIDEHTYRCWPARPNIPYAFKDLLAALEEFPESLA